MKLHFYIHTKNVQTPYYEFLRILPRSIPHTKPDVTQEFLYTTNSTTLEKPKAPHPGPPTGLLVLPCPSLSWNVSPVKVGYQLDRFGLAMLCTFKQHNSVVQFVNEL
jgi:hypothetical protein